MQAGVWYAGQVTMAKWRDSTWGRGRRGAWKAKICFHWGTAFTAEICEFLLHVSKERHSLSWRWLDTLQCGTRLFERCSFRQDDAHLCWIHSWNCLHNLVPSVGTNSSVSLQSGLLSNILLQACVVHTEYISTEGKPLWGGWQCSPLKKRIWRGRRESRLVSQSDSYFASIFITASPENWNWNPKEQLGRERTDCYVCYWLLCLWIMDISWNDSICSPMGYRLKSC